MANSNIKPQEHDVVEVTMAGDSLPHVVAVHIGSDGTPYVVINQYQVEFPWETWRYRTDLMEEKLSVLREYLGANAEPHLAEIKREEARRGRDG